MKRDPNAADARLTQKARQTVEETRLAEGRRWLYPEGRPFRVARVGLYLFGGVLCILLLAFLIALLLARADRTPSGDGYVRLVNDIRTTTICLLMMLGGVITCRIRQYAVCGVLSAAEAVLFLSSQNLQLSQLLVDGGWRPLIYTLPTLLFALCALYLGACDVAVRIRVKRTKSDFLRRIEASHPRNDDAITTAEEWNAYLEEFLAEPVHVKPKRSLKHRKKKEKKEED